MFNQFIPFLHFKLEGFSQLKHIIGVRLNVQNGPEGCILQCPIGSKLEEVCKVSVKGDSLRVQSTKSVYKSY